MCIYVNPNLLIYPSPSSYLSPLESISLFSKSLNLFLFIFKHHLKRLARAFQWYVITPYKVHFYLFHFFFRSRQWSQQRRILLCVCVCVYIYTHTHMPHCFCSLILNSPNQGHFTSEQEAELCTCTCSHSPCRWGVNGADWSQLEVNCGQFNISIWK